MLIYNSKKEFIGIDEEDLNKLGFASFTELKAQVNDFADLFVNTPGLIHNFTHVHWIDFITCADSSEIPHAIINANETNYKCNIHITTAFLSDNTEEAAYIIYLQNLHESRDNSSSSSSEPVVETSNQTSFIEQEDKTTNSIEADSEEPLDIIKTQPNTDSLDTPLEISFDTEETSKTEEIKEELNESEIIEDNDDFVSDYVFDPKVASDELGLPIDLIEEFIGDFIAQAKEFKPELYAAMEASELDTVRTLSHKLKGVAANLRIEDAFEVLATINTTNDFKVIEKNLNHLYIIIAKLAGEELPKNVTKEKEPEEEELDVILDTSTDIDDSQELVLSLKDDLDSPKISDADVPTKIDLPELADDDFLEDSPIELDDTNDEVVLDILEAPLDVLEVEEDSIEEIQEQESIKKTPKKIFAYNKNDIANEIGLDYDSFNELFTDYLIESKEISSIIKEAINENKPETWKHNAFKLKGMSDNMRINDFTNELETLIKTTEDLDAQKAITEIDEYISQITKMEL